MIRCVSAFVLATLLLAVFTASGHAEKRVALVVGNADYQSVSRLNNPVNDARLMADTLKGLGFTLIGGGAQINLDKAALDNAVQSFGKRIQDADVRLFYYAGHGVQVAGSNYLVPVNANPTREADVDFQMVDVNLVLRQMQGSGKELNLVILDACRNNPFGGRGLRATGGGLAQMRAPTGTLISYATQPGSVALDGVGGNSPYTTALAQAIQKPGLDIFQTFNQVGLAVQRSTGGSQQPWVSSSPIDGSFFFSAAPAAATPAPSSRLALALVADNPAMASGAPLHEYGNANTTYRIERDITFPGDIERFDAILDDRRLPAINLGLAAAALDRINGGAGVVGRRIALVLDGRTVLSAATLNTPLSANLQLSGNFSWTEIKRLVDAVAANPTGAR
jgi:Caspase domain